MLPLVGHYLRGASHILEAVIQSAVVRDGSGLGELAVFQAQLDSRMLDGASAVIYAGQIHLALLVHAATYVTTLHVALDRLLFPDIIADFLVNGILLESEAFLQSLYFLQLDRE